MELVEKTLYYGSFFLSGTELEALPKKQLLFLSGGSGSKPTGVLFCSCCGRFPKDSMPVASFRTFEMKTKEAVDGQERLVHGPRNSKSRGQAVCRVEAML